MLGLVKKGSFLSKIFALLNLFSELINFVCFKLKNLCKKEQANQSEGQSCESFKVILVLSSEKVFAMMQWNFRSLSVVWVVWEQWKAKERGKRKIFIFFSFIFWGDKQISSFWKNLHLYPRRRTKTGWRRWNSERKKRRFSKKIRK